MQGYSDNDWTGSLDDSKSTSGFVFLFGFGAFAWSSKKHEIVAQSTVKTEYIAAATTANRTIWLRKILNELGMVQ